MKLGSKKFKVKKREKREKKQNKAKKEKKSEKIDLNFPSLRFALKRKLLK
jgi:hypothetical protein